MTNADWRRFELSRLATFLFVALVVALLSGCAGSAQIEPPGERTRIDDRAAIIAEATWRASGAIVEAGLDVGLLSGGPAERVSRIDAEAELAIGLLRSAYDAGNADSYLAAAVSVNAMVEQLQGVGESWRSPGTSAGIAFDATAMLKVAIIAPVIIGSANELRETIASLGAMEQPELQRRISQLRQANDQARFRRIAKFASAGR